MRGKGSGTECQVMRITPERTQVKVITLAGGKQEKIEAEEDERGAKRVKDMQGT